jgi:hypothetical protein
MFIANSGETTLNARALTFHLFGEIELEDPRHFLSQGELSTINQYLPLIQYLERTWKERTLSLILPLMGHANRG